MFLFSINENTIFLVCIILNETKSVVFTADLVMSCMEN